MTLSKPVTQFLDVGEVRKRWDELVDAASRNEQQVVLKRDGKQIAALISVDDLARLRRYDTQREKDFAILHEIGERFKDLPDEEIEREVAKAVAEARAELEPAALEILRRAAAS